MNNYIFNIHLDDEVIAESIIAASRFTAEQIAIGMYPEAKYERWMKVLSNTPLGLELFMRVSTNYKQLQTIYYQRKNHRLKEDWGAFIKFIEELPYFKQLILGES